MNTIALGHDDTDVSQRALERAAELATAPSCSRPVSIWRHTD
jgi:hypothetical protein